jgi:cytochrome b6-f complex iron-sulfur subunit
MTARDVRRFVEDLLRGRRTRAFRPDDDDAAQMRAAITLRAARPGGGAAGEEFVASLHRRLAAELGEDEVAVARGSRRRVLQIGSVAAAAVVVGAAADHVIVGAGGSTGSGGGVLVPIEGVWTRVAASTEVPDGAVRAFDVDGVAGFVRRDGGSVAAVSGTCTHQGCRLRLDTQARNLRCPCHRTAFAVTGELLEHELPQPPPPLPQLQVREAAGAIEVLGPKDG